MSWLIAQGFLEIKIAVPLRDSGLPDDLDTHHLFHEKTGIFTDIQGNQLAFNGSNNESVSGWEQNVESFHVYCSWEGQRDLERVNEEQFRFEQLWNDLSPNVRIFEVPEAFKKRLLHYAPSAKPVWSKQIEEDIKPIDPEPLPVINPEFERDLSPQELATEREKFKSLWELPNHLGCLDYCLKSIPVQPWIHQLKILRRFTRNYPTSAIICDEV